MADDIFSYNQLSSNLSSTQQNRLTHYYRKQKNLYELLKGQTSELESMSAIHNQNELLRSQDDSRRKSMVGSLDLYGKNIFGKENWKNPNKYQWWNPSGGTFTPTPKWNEVTGKVHPFEYHQPGAPNTKTIGGKQFYQNPDWNLIKGAQNFSNRMANTQMGQLGSAASGKFATGAGILGMGLSYFGDDKDPTTYTGTEMLGDQLSWGSTGLKIGAMINPVLAIPAALLAAYYGGKMGQDAADRALTEKEEDINTWTEKINEFKRDQRDMHVIGGTQPIYQNWWDTKTGGYIGRG